MSHGKTKTLYLNFQQTFKDQIWHAGDVGWETLIYTSYGLVMSHCKIELLYIYFHKAYKRQTWHSRNLGWRLSLTKWHVLLIIVTGCHVTKQKFYFSIFTRPLSIKFDTVVT